MESGEFCFTCLALDVQKLILCCLDDYDLIHFGFTNHYYHSLIFTLEKKWNTLNLNTKGLNEKFLLQNVGKFAHTIKFGALPPQKVARMMPLLGHFCSQLDLLIIKSLHCPIADFISKLQEHCPNISGLEIHHSGLEVNFHHEHIHLLFQSFPKLNHIIIQQNDNFIHTQSNPRTIQAVIPLLEDLKNSKPNREDLYQACITLQFLYKKLKDPKSAERVVAEYQESGFCRPSLMESVLEMDERLLSLNCSRPLDQETCFYWNWCFTCGLVNFSGLCAHCVEHCHKGHKTVFEYIGAGAFCDCTSHQQDPKENHSEW
eukprot:TRINITY_DN5259_c0_g1_i1.p1 TRINITY_DN5259_c0_g1~~TRINITY_DN5259_c0_g1_i1.p1  ORF type:complete len:316 (+),score=79.13 TRINITY_DN5259_c0_g1_i1:7-954(+)